MNRFLFLSLLLLSCSKLAAQPKEITLSIEGMHCDTCVNAIATAVQELDGVISCKVSLKKNNAMISFKQPTNATQIINTITDLQFNAEAVSQ
tara:strand:+ start:171 stop:446 length:276 start_codon:yes stop_codon:yes gene_type:complete